MATKYLLRLTDLIQQTTSGRFNGVTLECKHFFSGAAVYADGRICLTLTPVGFAIKLPEKSRLDLLKKVNAKPLRYFPQGPIKYGYLVLPKAMLNDVRRLRPWLKSSIEYVLTLPKPLRKRRPLSNKSK